MSVTIDSRWDKLTLEQRLKAVGNDITRNLDFCLLAGVLVSGEFILSDAVPTACTNGKDVLFNPDFIQPLTRKQLRYLIIHELLHKFLKHHLPTYRTVTKKYPQLSNMAMDYVINGFIESRPSALVFVDRPTSDALVDKRFDDMSWLQVLKELLNENEEPERNGPSEDGEGEGDGNAGSDASQGHGGFDVHDFNSLDGLSLDEQEEAIKKLDDAINQGRALQKRLMSKRGTGGDLNALAEERVTDWRPIMRDFITDTCQGDEEATFAPPNRRFMPLDLLMPSTYSEAMEDLVVAGDTSGSMGPLYPVMFGEVAQILRTVKPRKVHVVWWDTEVAAVQTFDENSYDNIKDVLKPAGGGGTSPQCVLDYLSTNKIDPAAIVWLTDGYIDNFKTLPSCPSLWGVLDNERFTPPFGKVVHVRSVCL
jgi:predicted metal-dependent peptidase